ncbi:hypothetical protein CVT25_001851 [Psilocybe cyanescens]|uniref:G-protein coupled receptors family 1 profile domain-containing protein n=1 Tax=Psilocybe cyanescens TaxID=93625 RepID=A0A409WQG9_PSICY|nr:hypothetical protein CVT25_001851 [Psilocybe cyanescens]
MSVPVEDLPSLSRQISTISANLNSSMALNFLMGIYTMVYAGTMYLYLSRKGAHAHRRVVISAITVLYLISFFIFVLEWFFLEFSFVTNGDSRVTIFVASVEGGPFWAFVILEILTFALFVISDALLIWRSFHVWGRSLRIISIPVFFFVVEIAVMAFKGGIVDAAQAALESNIRSAQLFVSSGTTIMATSLIAYRIYSASQWNGTSSKGRFKHTVVILVESAAVYSLVFLVDAIITVIPATQTIGSFLCIAQPYTQVVLTIVGGLAPTVIVARIAHTSVDNTHVSTITHISGLNFQSHHTLSQHTDNDGDDGSLTGEERKPTFDV